MINGINNDNNELINSRLGNNNEIGSVITNPISNNNPYSKENKLNFIDESAISKDAYYLYERETDINKFTKLSLAGMDDTSYNEQVAELFANGVTNPFLVDDIDILAESLSNNEAFLNDIEFSSL